MGNPLYGRCCRKGYEMKNRQSSQLVAVRWMALLVLAGCVLLGTGQAWGNTADKAKKTKQTKVASADQTEATIQKTREKAPSLKGWHLNLEAVMNVPLDVGGRLVLEMPGRIRLATSLGVLPTSFVGVINTAMISAKVYSQDVANVLESSLGGSLVWRLHAEWRPFEKAGFYLGGGYGLATFTGGVNVATIASLAGASVPSQYKDALRYDMSSTLHLLNGELGWEWTMFRFVSMRLAVGFMGTITSQTSIKVTSNGSAPANVTAAAQSGANDAAVFIDNAYQSYVFSPYVSFSTGIRFF